MMIAIDIRSRKRERERFFSHCRGSVLYMIVQCRELWVHVYSNTALYPKGLEQTLLILSAGITQ